MAQTATPNVRPDERLVRVGPLAQLLTRPDIGALLGAVAVFFAFAYFARAVNWIGDPGIAAGWTDQAAQYGIVAVPVAPPCGSTSTFHVPVASRAVCLSNSTERSIKPW